MKIVIDIPEKVYDRFCNCYRFPDEVEEAIIAITDGEPLEQKPICPSAGIDCEDCPAYEKKTGWIPVSERLPEKNVEVLATTEWGAVTIAEMYSANDWFIHEGATNVDADELTAWMPLPEPYKAESEG